jgi:hypothetical protein
MADTKSIGQGAAEGFARTQNQPIPQNEWQPLPENAAAGQIPTFNPATIAPTTGPVPPAEQ